MTKAEQLLDDKRIKTVCGIGQGHKCCRYLVCGQYGFECAKHHTLLKQELDRRVATETIHARGDNCAGWIKLQHMN